MPWRFDQRLFKARRTAGMDVLGWLAEGSWARLRGCGMCPQPTLHASVTVPHPLPCTPLQAWRQGRTGYPLVDAAMREVRFELLRFVCGAFAAAACGVLLLSQSCAT